MTRKSRSTSGLWAARPISSTTASTARADLAAQQTGPDLGGREGRAAHLLVPCPQPRGVHVRQRAAQHGRAQGRPGDHLHGPRARAAHRHAGLRQDRRGALGGVRRLFGRGPARAHRGQPVEGGHHLRRRLHERQGGRAEADRRRSPQAHGLRRARHRLQAHRARRQHGIGPRLLVARPDGPARGALAGGQFALRNRGDGRRRPAVHAVHLRHHRQAQGHPAHPRRLHGRGGDHLKWVFDMRRKTATGAPPTPAGSPGTATSSTGRCCWARPASCTKARPPTPTPTAGGA
jgi:hypothetical protein